MIERPTHVAITRPGRRVAAALVVGAAALVCGSWVVAPAASGQIVETWVRTATEVVVMPSDRTAPGVEVTVTATVEDEDDAPIVGQQVTFLVDGQVVALGVLDEGGHAQTTVSPPIGAHEISVRFQGPGTDGRDLLSSSASQAHSVLPETCADQAEPGAGAVVRHAYVVALHRCPDPAGYAYWVDRLEAGAAPGVVVSALARSPEAIEVVVDDAYRRILDRPADPAGRQVWAAKLRGGWATSQLWAALAASPELVGSATADVDLLVERAFARIVGRPIDPDAHTYWRDRLLADDGVRSPTLRAMVVSAEVVDGIVADAYAAALGRPPTGAEAAAARTTIRTRRGDWRPLRADLLGLPEASTYAQRYPDPEGADV